MRAGIRISSLVPSGLVIESVSDSSDSIILAVRSKVVMAECPLCGAASRRIHSRYARQVADLPCAGRQIRLRVIARRFRCEIPHCHRKIFAERFGQDRLQFNGYLRREETNAAIMALVKDGVPLKEIVRRTGHSRKLARQVSRGESTDIFRTRQSPLDAHLPFIDAQWATGCRNGAELWRRLQAHGFRGSLRVVSEWTTRRRRAEKATNQQLQKVPSARTIARLMTTARDHLSKADAVTIAAIEERVPALVEARVLVEKFQVILRKRCVDDLDPWIAAASTGLIASFASGITNDKAAVRAAITEPWSNGQTEGQRLIGAT